MSSVKWFPQINVPILIHHRISNLGIHSINTNYQLHWRLGHTVHQMPKTMVTLGVEETWPYMIKLMPKSQSKSYHHLSLSMIILLLPLIKYKWQSQEKTKYFIFQSATGLEQEREKVYLLFLCGLYGFYQTVHVFTMTELWSKLLRYCDTWINGPSIWSAKWKIL